MIKQVETENIDFAKRIVMNVEDETQILIEIQSYLYGIAEKNSKNWETEKQKRDMIHNLFNKILEKEI